MFIAISYFYQVRFMKPYMIPMSTAVYDPKWYHNFKGENHVFVDRNGVINGLRIHPLMPPDSCNGLCHGRESCSILDSRHCDFISRYRRYLDSIDFDGFIEQLGNHVGVIKDKLKFTQEPIAVILVHESPDNLCSERIPLIEWFEDNGMTVRELLYPISQFYL